MQQRLGAAALAAAGVALLVAQIVDPPRDGSYGVALMAAAYFHGDRWLAAHLLFVVAAALLALGAPALGRLSTGRGRWPGLAATALLVFGAVGLAGWATSMFAVSALDDSDAMPRHIHLIRDEAGVEIVELVWILGLMGGLVLAAAALVLAHTVARWVPALLLAFVAVEALFVDVNWAETAGFICLAVGLGAAGWAAFRAAGVSPAAAGSRGTTRP